MAKVTGALADVVVTKGISVNIRSDNGRELKAEDHRRGITDAGSQTMYIGPGSALVNVYCERFNAKLRDEFLN